MSFEDVCDEMAVSPGSMSGFRVAGQQILLSNIDGAFYAIEGFCTHERAYLEKGVLEDCIVYCPLHFSSFDVRTGDVLGPPAKESVATFQVKVVNGRVLVDVSPRDSGGESRPEGSDVRSPSEPLGDDTYVTGNLPEDMSAMSEHVWRRFDSSKSIRRVNLKVESIVLPAYNRLSRTFVTDLLHGSRWFRHPVHAALTDIPIGFWFAAALLYVMGEDSIAVVVSLAGIVGALGAIVTGLADWAVSEERDRRVGLVHGVVNVLGTLLQCASVTTGLMGLDYWPLGLLLGGLMFTVVGGYLGGHLVFARGVMVNHTPRPVGPPGWTPTIDLEAIGIGESHIISLGGSRIILYRSGSDRVFALGAECSHAGAELIAAVDGVVSCPLHGSKFDACTGAVLKGPAFHAQPVFETRVQSGTIEVRQWMA